MALSVEDCELALIAIAGHDEHDPSTLPRPQFRRVEQRKGFRFATLAGATRSVALDVADRYHAALDEFRAFGSVEKVILPDLPFDAAASTIIAAEAASAFEEFLEAGAAAELTAPEDRVAILSALSLPATDYLRALRVRRIAIGALHSLLAPFDAVITPTRPNVAPLLTKRFSEEPKEPGARTIDGAANLCGLPGLAMPIGLGKSGLPVGISLTGRADSDATILAAGIAFQERTGFHRDVPPLLGENALSGLLSS